MIAKSRLHLAFLLSSLVGVSAFVSTACGGIADPTKGGEGRVATVSGALTGITVPANARVALVYRGNTAANATSHSVVVVGSDVAVIGGHFTMNLGVPADNLFSAVDAVSDGTSAAPPVAESPPSASAGGAPATGTSTSGSPGAFAAAQLAPRDIVGGQITEAMTAAVAGFVVYADTNGNGQLDLEGPYASSPDQILGGNKELFLVYLKGGGSLDYEKMRDKSGILPTAGFDLAWTQGRWLPLTDVELKLSANAQLPSTVCASSGGVDTVSAAPGIVAVGKDPSASGGGSSGSGSGGVSTTSDGGSGGTYYPSPSDPQLKCSADGRSYSYGDNNPTTCNTPPTGLCAGDVYPTTYCTGSTGYGSALAPGAPVPDGWPCPTAPDFDGGGAPDGSTFDGGVADGGVADGGSADGG
jgi:hypothetical protein